MNWTVRFERVYQLLENDVQYNRRLTCFGKKLIFQFQELSVLYIDSF